MKRTTIPVLLVVLTLFCASMFQPAAAWADQPEGALRAPGTVKPSSALLAGADGDAGDSNNGDPDAAGDALGHTKTDDLLGNSDSFFGGLDADWVELMLRLLDCFPIVP